MQHLFDIPPELPSGFHFYPEFISREEELNLVSLIKTFPLKNMIFQGYEAKRKTMNFGHDWHFQNRTLSKGLDIPEAFIPIIEKVGARLNITTSSFAEVLLTQYDPGTVINWHRDAPPFEKIAGVSLLSDCVFKLRPYTKTIRKRSDTISFHLPRRSLYMMEGEVRTNWEHSIAPLKNLRYSITLRTLYNKSDPEN
jgi:alkylated DNA repair dioxygenase AlkB